MLHASLWMDSVHELLRSYGLWIVFIALTLECAGIPTPGEALLVSAAIYAGSTHRLTIESVVLVASAGAALGGMFGYAIGRSIGLRLLVRYGKYVKLDERRLKIGQYLFLLHGGKIVLAGRFVDPLRIFGGVLAGANRMRWSNFLLTNTLGAVVWVAVIAGGAYLFGVQIKRVAGLVSLLLLVGVVALIAGGVIFYRRHERELELRAEKAIPGPLVDIAAQ